MSEFSKGRANQRTLADRMKSYEAVTTETKLIEKLPIYARIDQRAGHTFTHRLNKPFDLDYAAAMQDAVKYIIEHTGAAVGYCQSDEASFVWTDHTKIPFETRLFKLQSVLASMFTAAFVDSCMKKPSLRDKLLCMLPSFDCRVMNMPDLDEAANMILWRERDSIKNSITLISLEYFSNRELHKKNSKEKIQMLAQRGVDYYSYDESLRNGAYFRRELYDKVLSDIEVIQIPASAKRQLKKNSNGDYYVVRSHVCQFYLNSKLEDIENKVQALFNGDAPIVRQTIGQQQKDGEHEAVFD